MSYALYFVRHPTMPQYVEVGICGSLKGTKIRTKNVARADVEELYYTTFNHTHSRRARQHLRSLFKMIKQIYLDEHNMLTTDHNILTKFNEILNIYYESTGVRFTEPKKK
jgi:hypothetical protein